MPSFEQMPTEKPSKKPDLESEPASADSAKETQPVLEEKIEAVAEKTKLEIFLEKTQGFVEVELDKLKDYFAEKKPGVKQEIKRKALVACAALTVFAAASVGKVENAEAGDHHFFERLARQTVAMTVYNVASDIQYRQFRSAESAQQKKDMAYSMYMQELNQARTSQDVEFAKAKYQAALEGIYR